MNQTKPLPKPRKSNKKSVHSVASSAEQLSVGETGEEQGSESFAPHTLVPVSMVGFYPVSTDGWVKSLKAWSLASSLRWMSGLWNRSM